MKFLVIGDSCTDIFVYGECNRLCPEAPVPVFNPQHSTSNAGMAGNVAANIRALGRRCDLITNINQPKKTRYVDNKTNQMIVRVDENDTINESFNIDNIDIIDQYDAIIISEYDKGFLTPRHVTDICDSHDNVFIDSKKIDLSHVNDCRYLKINEYEFERAKHSISIEPTKLIVTRGGSGCEHNGTVYPPRKVREVRDVSGAGDTFMAALVIGVTSGKSISVAIDWAQQCAADVIRKRGVATTKRDNDEV
jgi:D-beta-D-heptose 7-phosphate kinase/D-beta-D-heptose 1-phosphate adenosyltransferase